MATIPDHIHNNISQRQLQRTRWAQTIDILLSEPRLSGLAAQFVQRGLALLHEDQCDLNGTLGVRAAILIERESWETIQRIAEGAPSIPTEDILRASTHLESIKRAIEVQATLIDLAIPVNNNAPLQVLHDEYQQRYGNKPQQ